MVNRAMEEPRHPNDMDNARQDVAARPRARNIKATTAKQRREGEGGARREHCAKQSGRGKAKRQCVNVRTQQEH